VRTSAKFTETAEEQFYIRFLSQILDDGLFASTVIQWGWAQFLDVDMLRGYADNLRVVNDLQLVKKETLERFTAAIRRLSVKERFKLVWIAREESYKLRHVPPDISLTIEQLASAKGMEATSSALRAGLEGDLKRCTDLAEHFGLPEDSAPYLFLLAHVGSVCVRGLRYAEVYCRDRATDRVIYWPHLMRSRYFDSVSDLTNGITTPSERMYLWSWGSVLAECATAFPRIWTADHLQETLFELKHDLKRDSISLSVDSANINDVPTFLERLELTRYLELARKYRIVVDEEKGIDTLQKLGCGFGRLLPRVVALSVEELMESAGLKLGLHLFANPALEGLIDNAEEKRRVYAEKFAERWLVLRDLSRVAFGQEFGSPVGAIAKRGRWSMKR
jgi:hypothetical protein